MGCLYSLANNRITVTGYTSDVPCDFDELHTQDKAGMLDLMPATLPALNMTLTNQIKPSDELALKIDFILASSGAGAGDTIDITGTDKDGNAQSETLTTTADGTFTTTKWFKTITDIDCNGFSSGTLTVRQNQWGVVWKLSDYNFILEATIYLGDASNDAWFGDCMRIIYARGVTGNIFSSPSGKGHLCLGLVKSETDRTGYCGCQLIANENVYPCSDLKELFLYDTFWKTGGGHWSKVSVVGTDGRCWNSKSIGGFIGAAGNFDVNNFMVSTGYKIFEGFTTTGEVTNTRITDANTVVSLRGGQTFSIKDLYARGISNYIASGEFFSGAGNCYMIDWDVDWAVGFSWSMGASKVFFRQYTFNLKVIDKDGNGIGNATVTLKDKDGNTADQKGFSTTTSDADATRGEITEQTVSYGYYNQANGNTLQSYSPHTLTIARPGFLTYRKSFNLDEKVNWKIGLKHSIYSNIVGIE